MSDEVTIEICTTAQVRDDLVRLVATGFYGSSVETAAEEMLRERLRQILEKECRREHVRRARDRKNQR